MSYGNKNFNPTAQKPHFSHKTLPHCLGPWATNPSMAEFPQLLRSTWSLKTSWVSGTRWENDVKSSMSMFFRGLPPVFARNSHVLVAFCHIDVTCYMILSYFITNCEANPAFATEANFSSLLLQTSNGFVWTGIHTKNDHGHREIQVINKHKPMNEM